MTAYESVLVAEIDDLKARVKTLEQNVVKLSLEHEAGWVDARLQKGLLKGSEVNR